MAKVACSCGCGDTFEPKHGRKYASEACKKRAAQRRYRARQKAFESKPARTLMRRGPQYETFVKEEWPQAIRGGTVNMTDVADHFGVNPGTISRWMAAVDDDQLSLEIGEVLKTEDHLSGLADFTRRYFEDLDVPGFHEEWEESIDETVGTGGQLLLLAPQRFGKSELLIRYCIRRIAKDPNISIGWVSKTAGLAERMVGYIRQVLEDHEQLIMDIAGPKGFRPDQRSGKPWTNGEFTVATRTVLKKSPTMEALGIGGTIAGKDFDLIVLDDPQDRTRCLSPSQRKKDVEWFTTDFLSRKMDHTGVAFIMSRQHVEDLPGHIIREQDDWRVKVYRAHNPACPHSEREPELHADCVLWPKMRSFEWLMKKKKANLAHFERNYQNNPRTDITILLSMEDVDRCKDHDRAVGEVPRLATRLVAGIDPADAKPVAGVLWGFEQPTEEFPKGRRHVIDCMEAEPGVRGGREIIRKWMEEYHVPLFVVETNYAQSWWEDRDLKDILGSTAQIKGHYTSRINKWSDSSGVVAMLDRMRGDPPEVTFPWKDTEARSRVERLVETLLLFDPDHAHHKNVDDDLAMAAWFPQQTMDGWVAPPVVRVESNFSRTPYVEWGANYPGFAPRRVEVA